MTKGTHLLRSALLALLALAVISGGSLAAGDLFDDDYADCPTKTRLRGGEISDLAVARDADDEDHVNVSWAATDPDSWNLGSNAYNTSLVVILDDGDSHTQTLSLGARKTTFEGVATGTEVTVQLAIVVDTADGDYLISDILEASINQSLTEPAFMTTDWMRVTAVDDPDTDADEFAADAMDGGTLYYVGYNENFGNYKSSSSDLTTSPSTPRLRIGLVHGGENADARDDVDFDAYIVRVTDEGGDVVPEGDDVATVASSYAGKLVAGTKTNGGDDAFRNVRINDGGDILVAMQNADSSGLPFEAPTDVAPQGLSFIGVKEELVVNNYYAEPPDEHRDFPIDILASDETYTFEAWAVNEDGEVISPVASLMVRPLDEDRGTVNVTDYKNTTAVSVPLVVTEFTVLK